MSQGKTALPAWRDEERGVSASPELMPVSVVVPCYRVSAHIQGVISSLPNWIERIYIVDDCCPEQSGKRVEAAWSDLRINVIYNRENLGVGGAVMAGYEQALRDGASIVVKMDGDGQMDPASLLPLLRPILRGEADYTKGNRFYSLDQISRMPRLRIIGNALLSFLNKISSGYWDLFDPTNGFTAIHTRVLAQLPLHKVSRRYFFESDMLFRLNILRAVVVDVPMDSRYGAESSNLKVSRVLFDFASKHVRNTAKRIFYNYFLRDLSLASFELVFGLGLIASGLVMGAAFWMQSWETGVTASAGSVMLVALQLIVGLQFILGFIAYDIAATPRRPLHRLLSDERPHG